jgi:hypothetical protein
MRTNVFAFALVVALIATVAPGCTMPSCEIPQVGTIQPSAARHCSMSSAEPVTPPADEDVALVAGVAPACAMPCCKMPQMGMIQSSAAQRCPTLCGQVTPSTDGVVAPIISDLPALHPIDEVPPATTTPAHISDLDHNPRTSSPPAVYLLDGTFLI